MEKIVSPELPKPEYARNMRLLGHTDMGGRPDGQQVMVNQGYACVGHMFVTLRLASSGRRPMSRQSH